MIAMELGTVAEAIGAALEPPDGKIRVVRVTTDSRDVRPGDLFVAIPGESFDGHRFIPQAVLKGAAACVCSRVWFDAQRWGDEDRAPRLLIVEDTVAALGRLATHYRRQVMSPATVVVAVTGTNGKTTTKDLLDHVLSGSLVGQAAPKSFNNQIGVPLTLLSAEAGDRYLIVEIGTNAPGEVASLASMTSPDVGVITSIGEAHLEGLGSIDGVAAEKASLLDHVRPSGLTVVNVDRQEIIPRLAKTDGQRLVTVGHGEDAAVGVSFTQGDLHRSRFEVHLPTVLNQQGVREQLSVDLPMPGRHQGANVAAAVAVARWLGVAPDRIVERMRSFRPAEGRTRVLTLGGVIVVDDAYNANPASMSAAIDTLSRAGSGRRVLVMGDMLELGSHSASLHVRAVTAAFENRIDILVAVGPAVARAARETGRGDAPTRIVQCENAAETTDRIMEIVEPGDTVWIKGSRAVALDRVVRDLEARFGATEPKAPPRANTRRSAKAGGVNGKARQSADVKTG